jgi:hypothetical protein
VAGERGGVVGGHACHPLLDAIHQQRHDLTARIEDGLD